MGCFNINGWDDNGIDKLKPPLISDEVVKQIEKRIKKCKELKSEATTSEGRFMLDGQIHSLTWVLSLNKNMDK